MADQDEEDRLPWLEAVEADDEVDGDVRFVVHACLAALLVIGWSVTIAIIVPGLINLHNDGMMIAAVALAIGATAAAYILGRLLLRSYLNGDKS